MLHFVKKYYIQLIVVLIFVVLTVIIIAQSFSMLGRIKAKSGELKQAQLDYVLAGEFLNNIYTFKKNTAYIDTENDQLNMLLPNDDDEKVRLFSFLEQLAKDTGNNSIALSVKAVDAKKAKKDDEKEKKSAIAPTTGDFMNMEITLVGNYDDLIEFMTRLENMQYFADVLSFSTGKTGAAVNKGGDEEPIAIKREDLLKTTMNVVFYLDK